VLSTVRTQVCVDEKQKYPSWHCSWRAHPVSQSPLASLHHVNPEQLVAVQRRQQPSAQGTYPEPQVYPQLTPSQVAAPFSGTGHAAHRSPHVATSVLCTHAGPQR
jgi:hypothetical protein